MEGEGLSTDDFRYVYSSCDIDLVTFHSGCFGSYLGRRSDEIDGIVFLLLVGTAFMGGLPDGCLFNVFGVPGFIRKKNN
ncbi:hypothetical protein CXB51_001665 [Gossypium anomalum]|uniref:Uncharacterized protein n=1 Tax=Gossypium anomalum TaxID=47600 RepID=A0A8J5ZK18_9ROSI|nr:hypothetical protein CXB51_001665 [Gossypium anomalum]